MLTKQRSFQKVLFYKTETNKLLLCCLPFYRFAWSVPAQSNYTTHHLVHYLRICRGNLSREFSVAICCGKLLWGFAARICCGCLRWEFDVADCRQNLPLKFVNANGLKEIIECIDI